MGSDKHQCEGIYRVICLARLGEPRGGGGGVKKAFLVGAEMLKKMLRFFIVHMIQKYENYTGGERGLFVV